MPSRGPPASAALGAPSHPGGEDGAAARAHGAYDLERARVYDPTALTFKDIHGSLFMDVHKDNVGGARWAPSQAYLIFGCREHLFRYALAGLRYSDSNEAHLEHRHAIRKAFIDICVLHHTGI